MKRLTLNDAKRIRELILRWAKNIDPEMIYDVQILGGVKQRGYSYHDIDLYVLYEEPGIFDENGVEYIGEKIRKEIMEYISSHANELMEYLHILFFELKGKQLLSKTPHAHHIG